jgi:putative ATP-grasp target RiPP
MVSVRELFPLGQVARSLSADSPSRGVVRPFGLRFLTPARQTDAVDVSGVGVDPVSQIGVRAGVPLIEVIAAGTQQTPYTTTEDHQKWTDHRSDRPSPR